MIRHTALIRFKDEVTPAEVEKMEAGLRALPDKISAIEAYAFGRDLGVSKQTWDYAIVADFADVEAFHAYQVDPDHVEVVTYLTGPLTAEIQRVQFEF
jgi:Stress responsive A/B Barrel Domain